MEKQEVLNGKKSIAEFMGGKEDYNVNVSKFIRSAIREKISKDWKSIKEKKERIKTPF